MDTPLLDLAIFRGLEISSMSMIGLILRYATFFAISKLKPALDLSVIGRCLFTGPINGDLFETIVPSGGKIAKNQNIMVP